MSASTATGTIATARTALHRGGPPRYRGRFAPSPTGLLHSGSLLAALGSYLRARSCQGEWLLRIEDLDTPRVVPGAADQIVRTLEHFGFEWDGAIVRQSERTALYASAIDALATANLLYPCSCSRQDLAQAARASDVDANDEPYYPGNCRNGPRRTDAPLALRLRTPDRELRFADELQGECTHNVAREVGDFVVRRRDGLHAYQLAVVVDDAEQGITEVVRGIDLLTSTPRQMLLQEALGLAQPRYLHLPLLVEADGQKLAKSRRSVPVAGADASAQLHAALTWLGQRPPAELALGQPTEVMKWAIGTWDLAPLRGRREVRL
ncbi:MAG TPA: tRNA glutamyl-Q(34) synthetase GluQRS [Steroidobacteraceae bacterium]|nr:tRNA glutamyl-Q(34) synthetase GluQRS [Steroidobacteraceae bacterium]